MRYLFGFLVLGCTFFGLFGLFFVSPKTPMPTAWTDGNCQTLKPEIEPSHFFSTEEIDAVWKNGRHTPSKIVLSQYGSVKNFFSLINGESVKVDIVEYYSSINKAQRQDVYLNGEEMLTVALKIVNQFYEGPVSISNRIFFRYSSTVNDPENKHFYLVIDDGGSVYDTKVEIINNRPTKK